MAPAVAEAMRPPKRVTGPVSGYNADVGNYICRQIWSGRFLGAICNDPGMPDRYTVYTWTAAHPEFRQAYALARQALADAMAEEAVAISDDASDDFKGDAPNPASVARAKLRVDVRRWVAARMNPKSWGQQVEHAGEVIHRHLIDRPPDESREQWLARRRQELALPAPPGARPTPPPNPPMAPGAREAKRPS